MIFNNYRASFQAALHTHLKAHLPYQCLIDDYSKLNLPEGAVIVEEVDYEVFPIPPYEENTGSHDDESTLITPPSHSIH